MRAKFARIRRAMHRACLLQSCQELACLSSGTRCSSSPFVSILYYHVRFEMAGPLLPYYFYYIDCLLLDCIARAYTMHADTQLAVRLLHARKDSPLALMVVLAFLQVERSFRFQWTLGSLPDPGNSANCFSSNRLRSSILRGAFGVVMRKWCVKGVQKILRSWCTNSNQGVFV